MGKEKNNNKNKRALLYVLQYWIIFIIVPFFLSIILDKYNFIIDRAGYIMFYVILISPFCYIILYKIIAPSKYKVFIILPTFLIFVWYYKKILKEKLKFIKNIY